MIDDVLTGGEGDDVQGVPRDSAADIVHGIGVGIDLLESNRQLFDPVFKLITGDVQTTHVVDRALEGQAPAVK